MQFRNGSYAFFAVQGNKIRNMKTNWLKRKQENEEKEETYGTEKKYKNANGKIWKLLAFVKDKFIWVRAEEYKKLADKKYKKKKKLLAWMERDYGDDGDDKKGYL